MANGRLSIFIASPAFNNLFGMAVHFVAGNENQFVFRALSE